MLCCYCISFWDCERCSWQARAQWYVCLKSLPAPAFAVLWLHCVGNAWKLRKIAATPCQASNILGGSSVLFADPQWQWYVWPHRKLYWGTIKQKNHPQNTKKTFHLLNLTKIFRFLPETKIFFFKSSFNKLVTHSMHICSIALPQVTSCVQFFKF